MKGQSPGSGNIGGTGVKILWIMQKQLDVALDKTARIEMIKCLRKRGHEIIFVTGYRKNKKRYGLNNCIRYVPSVNITFLNYLTFNISVFFIAIYYLTHYKPDVVITCPDTAPVLWTMRTLGIAAAWKSKVIMDIRTLPAEFKGWSNKAKDLLFSVSLKLAARRFEGITVITPFMRELVAGMAHLDQDRLGIWSSGVSLQHFDPETVAACGNNGLRRKLGLEGAFVLIYHGVLSPNRGLEEAIRAMKLVKESSQDVVLLIVGDGPQIERLKEMVKCFRLEKFVKIPGQVSYNEIPEYLSIADCGILPFPKLLWWRVSSPIKLMEYMAMEKPVIVTDIEAHREVADPETAAVFIPSNKPEEIARAILDSRRSLKHLKEAGKRARTYVENNYTWDHQSKRLEDYVNGLCKD